MVGSSVVEGGVKAMGIVVAVDESEDFGACIGGVEKKMTTKFKFHESKNPLLDCLRRKRHTERPMKLLASYKREKDDNQIKP